MTKNDGGSAYSYMSHSGIYGQPFTLTKAVEGFSALIDEANQLIQDIKSGFLTKFESSW